MGGLREERFVKSGRRTRTRDTWSGGGGETGSVTKKKNKNRRQVSVPASSCTSGCCVYLCYIRWNMVVSTQIVFFVLMVECMVELL